MRIPGPGRIHISEDPGPRVAQGGPGPGWTHINEDPGPGGTHISEEPRPRGIHISEDPRPRGIHISEDPGPRGTHISEDPRPRGGQVGPGRPRGDQGAQGWPRGQGCRGGREREKEKGKRRGGRERGEEKGKRRGGKEREEEKGKRRVKRNKKRKIKAAMGHARIFFFFFLILRRVNLFPQGKPFPPGGKNLSEVVWCHQTPNQEDREWWQGRLRCPPSKKFIFKKNEYIWGRLKDSKPSRRARSPRRA